MLISFISKVTRVHKAMTVANNTSLCSTILVLFSEFIPVDRAESSHILMVIMASGIARGRVRTTTTATTTVKSRKIAAILQIIG